MPGDAVGVVTDAALLLELRRLAMLVEGLADDVRHIERRRLAADDRRMGAALVQASARLTAVGEVFSVPMLAGRLLNDDTPAAAALLAYGSVRALGRLAQRVDGVEFAGLRLVGCGERRDGRTYRVARVSVR